MPIPCSTAILIASPCLIALLVYDLVAPAVPARGPVPGVVWHGLVQDVLEDLGLTAVYALAVTPRVSAIAASYSARVRRLCLIMLGLGLAWYVVVCGWLTRQLAELPGLAVGIVLLVVIPVLLAPWSVQWIRTKVPDAHEDESNGLP